METKINKNTKKFLLNKSAKKLIEENRQMIKDWQEICHKVLMFRASWGIEVGIILKNTPQEVSGRNLSAGKVDELFNPQEYVNSKTKNN